MVSFFHARKWLVSCLIRLFLTFKQTHCAGGPSSSTITSKVPVVEVHGVNEANIDQKYTELLLDTDEIAEPLVFIQRNCCLSTFLFVRGINEIRQHPKHKEKFNNWIKGKTKKIKTKNEVEAKRIKVNLKDFQTRIAEFDKMLGGMQFSGSECQFPTLYLLGDLWDLLHQVDDSDLDIGKVQIGRRVEETEQDRKERLHYHAGLFHTQALLELVNNYALDNRGGELISRISHQHLDDTAMLAMKRRLRLVVGICIHTIELMEPILFRIDLVAPAHLLSLYQKILSLRVDAYDEQNTLLHQISIPRAVRVILDLKHGQNEGEADFIDYFREYWKNNMRREASHLQKIMEKLIDYFQTMYKLANPMAVFYELIANEERKAALSLFQTEKLGERFKQFLDKTNGAKGRLIYMLAYGKDTRKFVLQNQDLARLMIGDRSHMELLNELINAYIESFSGVNTDEKTQKAHLTADVLLQVRELSIKFGKEKTKAHDQWTLYRAMFLLFLDQLEDGKPEFVQMFGPLYRQMLLKLKAVLEKDKGEHQGQHFDFEALLSNEFRVLGEYNLADAKENLSSQAVIIVDELMENRMEEDHRRMIYLIEGTEYKERLERSLNPMARKKFDAFMKRKTTTTTSKTSITPENAIALPSTSTSTSFPFEPTTSSSYYDCSSTENKQKKIGDFINKPGFDQFMAYKYNLLLFNSPAQKAEWEKKVNLHLSIWHYGKLIDALCSSIGAKFPKEFDGLNRFWKVTEKLEANSRREALEQKLCKYFHFMFLVYQFLETKTGENHVREALLKRIQMMVVFPDDRGSTFLSADKLHCNNDDSPGIADKMINKLEKKGAHFHYLNFVLDEYEVFSVFFCGENMLILKDKLHQMIGAKFLAELEIMHPDVLKIRHFQKDVRFYLYEQFVENRKDSPEAFAAENRLTMSLALVQFEEIEQRLRDKSFGNGIFCEAVMKKAKWLKQLTLGNLDKMVSVSFVCMLCHFRDLIGQYEVGKNQQDSLASQVAAKMVAGWHGQECIPAAGAQKVVMEQRTEFSDDHKAFLRSNTERAMELVKLLGRRARLRRLIPGFDQFKYNEKLFTSASIVRNQIKYALLGEDEEQREMSLLGLNFLSWVRGINAELAEENDSKDGQYRHNSLARQILRDIWNDEQRQQSILRKFDEIFDEYFSDLRAEFILGLDRMQSGILELVQEWRNSKVKSKENWRKRVEKLFDNEIEHTTEESSTSVQQRKGKSILKNLKFETWLQSLNRQQMLSQLTQQHQQEETLDHNGKEESVQDWHLQLKEALEKDKTARERLLTLFGRKRAEIEPILKAIPLENIDFDELGLIEEESKDKDEAKNDEEVEKQKKKEKNDRKKMKKLEVKAKKKKDAEESHNKELAKTHKEDTEEPHKLAAQQHHGSEHNDNDMKENEHEAIGSGQATAANASQSTQQRTDESDHVTGESEPIIKVEAVFVQSPAGERHSIATEEIEGNDEDKEKVVIVASPLASHSDSTLATPPSSPLVSPKRFPLVSSLLDSPLASPKSQKSESDENKTEVPSSSPSSTPPHVKVDKKNKGKWSNKKKKSEERNAIVAAKPVRRRLHLMDVKQQQHSLVEEKSEEDKGQFVVASPLASPKTPTSTFEQTPTEVSSSHENEMEATTVLLDILREKGYIETAELNQRIEAAVENMKTIVNKWKNEAMLLIGGSYLLKLHTAHSDIDTVLLLPFEQQKDDDWIVLCKQQFFGYNQIGTSTEEAEEEIVCNLESEERNCSNASLYCILCNNTDVTFLMRMNGRDGDPMLKLKLNDFDFDISFVPMPKTHLEEKFYASKKEENFNLDLLPSSVQKFDILITGFIDWIGLENNDNRKGMLWALSAYRANLRIQDLLNDKPANVFQPTLLALKLWAKNHFVYGSMFGLLNGTALTTMLLDVFIKNSHLDSVPLLLEKFFDTFCNWEWPEIVELDRAIEVDSSKYEVYDWTVNTERNARGNQLKVHVYKHLFKEGELVWPVIVPGFPTQNAAFNVNGWTKLAILRQFGKALAQMNILRSQIGADKKPMKMNRGKWKKWLNGGHFENKYDHFMVIVCAANSAQQMGKFCDFVETRIRLQLLFTFGDLDEVKWMHASPERVMRSDVNAPCPSAGEAMEKLPAGNNSWQHCTIWLVGIELVKGTEQQKDIRQSLEEKMTQMIDKFSDERSNESAASAQEPTQPNRLENFTQKIHESFKYRERKRAAASSSSPHAILNRSYSSNVLPTNNNYNSISAESPRGTGVVVESPRGSPYSNSDDSSQRHFTRQSSMPTTLRHTAPIYKRQSSSIIAMSSSAATNQQGQIPSIVEAEVGVINEKLWAKYMDKTQLQAWLQKIGEKKM